MEEKENKDIESQIIETAKIIFVEKGYDATKMGDIANQVGISRTAMHYYFRTKDILFAAIIEQLMGKLLPNLENVLNQPGTILDKLPGIIREYNNVLRANPGFPLFILNEIHRDPEHLYEAVLKNRTQIGIILRLREQIIQEMKEGVLKNIPLINLLTTFISLMVFPLLIKKPFSAAILDGNEELYNEFLNSREEMIYDILKGLLDPDK